MIWLGHSVYILIVIKLAFGLYRWYSRIKLYKVGHEGGLDNILISSQIIISWFVDFP